MLELGTLIESQEQCSNRIPNVEFVRDSIAHGLGFICIFPLLANAKAAHPPIRHSPPSGVTGPRNLNR